MNQFELDTKEELGVLRHILQGLIGSYVIGWIILIINAGRIPLLESYGGIFWEIGAFVSLCLTVWLAITLSARALTWWIAGVMSIVSARSFAYILEGVFNPLGVWLLVATGVSITAMAVIAVNAVTGRLEKLHR